MNKSKNNKKEYYKNLNIIRVIACIAVLFYHLGILKGGYLAVCTFFVLSGYLSCVTSFKKENFSYKEYYISRLKKIYIPLVMVTLISVAIVSFFSSINWLSLKIETTSVLLGYNNFWQINANLDYFARHVDSPFMHLWYISILLQFDLVFPFIYKGLKKLGDKVDKLAPCAFTFILAVIGTAYFYKCTLGSNLMNAYYNTFARVYSILFGLCLGFIHSYYKPLVPEYIRKKPLRKIIFGAYLVISIVLFCLIDSNSKLFTFSMIIITLISCRLIDYAVLDKKELNILDKILKVISDLSYEIYLVQYPVIFLFQYININHYLKTPLIIIIVLIISYVLHMVLNKRDNMKIVRRIILVVIIGLSVFGGYKYITTKSHEKEMKQLEAELAENEKIMLEKQKEYQILEKKEEEDWAKQLEELENKKKLGNPVVIHLGTNGDCKNNCKEKIMDLLNDKTVFWINTTNYTYVNDNLNELGKKYDNLHIIDWYSLSKGHSDWFYGDGIHLPPTGRKEYTNIIYNAIVDVYKDTFKDKKEQLIKEHQEELKKKMVFYGNDILFYDFETLQSNFKDSKFVINKDFSYKDLKESVEKSIKENTLANKIVLAFDNSIVISIKEYQELIELCKNSKLYIVSSGKPLNSLESYSNVTVINFYTQIQKNKDYLMADGIHLTEKGNTALNKILESSLKDK